MRYMLELPHNLYQFQTALYSDIPATGLVRGFGIAIAMPGASPT